MSTWVIPCNESKYDHRGAFSKLQCVDWRQSTNVEVGDIVYIYVGRPTGCIMYKTTATEVDIYHPNDDDREFRLGEYEQHDGRYMTLKLLSKFPEGKFSRSILMDNGLKTVQGPSKACDELISFLELE